MHRQRSWAHLGRGLGLLQLEHFGNTKRRDRICPVESASCVIGTQCANRSKQFQIAVQFHSLIANKVKVWDKVGADVFHKKPNTCDGIGKTTVLSSAGNFRSLQRGTRVPKLVTL
eukprot:384852-Rhodomonas_salina.1